MINVYIPAVLINTIANTAVVNNLVQFKATVRKYGSSAVVTIPADYISNGLLDLEKTYKFEVVEEVQDVE